MRIIRPIRPYEVQQTKDLLAQGYSIIKIAKIMNRPESTIRIIVKRYGLKILSGQDGGNRGTKAWQDMSNESRYKEEFKGTVTQLRKLYGLKV